MISRRLLRTKVLQICYSYFNSNKKTIANTEKELFFSISKTYELYHNVFLLMFDITKYAEMQSEKSENGSDSKFVKNKLIEKLSKNNYIKHYIETNSLSWSDNHDLIIKLYASICETDIYKEYIQNKESSFYEDKKFWINILHEVISESDELSQALEDKSIYWNDDFNFVISVIINIIKKLQIGTESSKRLFSLYKKDEDKEFVKTLFRKTILKYDENKKLIKDNVKNWSINRVAEIDMLILQMGVTEAVEFLSIPINVTMNEYIEISKYYSTVKSSTFVNGILDAIIKKLIRDKTIIKTGRGLYKNKNDIKL